MPTRDEVIQYLSSLTDDEFAEVLREARNTPVAPRPRPGVDRMAQGLADQYSREGRRK